MGRRLILLVVFLAAAIAAFVIEFALLDASGLPDTDMTQVQKPPRFWIAVEQRDGIAPPTYRFETWEKPGDPAVLKSNESLRLSQREWSIPEGAHKGLRVFRVLDEDARQQTIELYVHAAMLNVTCRYRVQDGRIVPLSQRELGGLYAILLFIGSLWLALIFTRWVRRRFLILEPASG